MTKRITENQIIGELGEVAVQKRFLSMGFQFDKRGRLEAGIDGIVEIMISGQPSARMLAVQIKSTKSNLYPSENDVGFSFYVRSKDVSYWKNSNLPVIIVLYRESDDSYYWKHIDVDMSTEQRKIQFIKSEDKLDQSSIDRLASLTVPRGGFGYYVPPLRGGEIAVVNMLPIKLPGEIFVASTPFDSKRAIAEIINSGHQPRFDWVINGGTYWSFHDPRESSTQSIVDVDQVEAVDTSIVAYHEDTDQRNLFAFLLRKCLEHQTSNELNWDRFEKKFFFKPDNIRIRRTEHYNSFKNATQADVVSVSMKPKSENEIAFVRHHAFFPRFEYMLDQWFLIVNPTYHFTLDGYRNHPYPSALLAGKKRLDNNAALRGQLMLWYRTLSRHQSNQSHLFSVYDEDGAATLDFEPPPEVQLPTTVPEDAWGSAKKPSAESAQTGFTYEV